MGQVSQAGIGKRLGAISKVTADFTSPLAVAYSRVVIGAISAATSLVGRHIYCQHLLSARNVRNALMGHSNGIVLSVVKLILSCVGNHLRVAAAVLSS